MFFSSIPSILHPSNWQQSQNQQIIGNSNGGGGPAHLLQPPKPVLPHGLIWAGSMAERARMANIPMPEAALKCPRCESINTKFCYFNNYNLSQPRHFCKTCRRYWTRGGALRSVPIGGGCRRNKRSSKSSSSKTAATSALDPTHQTNNNNNNIKSNHISSSTMISNTSPINGLGPGPIGFMPSLPHLAQNFGHHQNMGLGGSYPGPAETGCQGTAGLLGGQILLSGPNSETWRLLQQVQNFPLFGGLEQPYQFQGGDAQQILMGGGGCAGHHQGLRPKFSSSMLAKVAVGPVKMEESPPELIQSRRLLGGSLAAGNEQWSWTELSGFSSSDPPQATLCKEK